MRLCNDCGKAEVYTATGFFCNGCGKKRRFETILKLLKQGWKKTQYRERFEQGLCIKCGSPQMKVGQFYCSDCYKICLRTRDYISNKEKNNLGFKQERQENRKAWYNKTEIYTRHQSQRIMNTFSLSLKKYKELTGKCFLCGFDNCIHLHHFDKNKHNNSLNNLIPLCPNHHWLIHSAKHGEKVKKEISSRIVAEQATQSVVVSNNSEHDAELCKIAAEIAAVQLNNPVFGGLTAKEGGKNA